MAHKITNLKKKSLDLAILNCLPQSFSGTPFLTYISCCIPNPQGLGFITLKWGMVS